jgi:hypothetical protein
MSWSSYDLWKSDIGPWPSIDEDDDGLLLRHLPWSRPRLPAVSEERVSDLTDEPVTIPERTAEVLDLTDPATVGDVLDLADLEPVHDLTGPEDVLDLAELVVAEVDSLNATTRTGLLNVYDHLTSDEQDALVREALAGDRLAQHILAALERAGVAGNPLEALVPATLATPARIGASASCTRPTGTGDARPAP